MSEALIMPPAGETAVKRPPTVYFIDDSATMREVIKIAFRRENINVITCADAASALAQFEQNRPDVVITDVIMPGQDGYSVCSQIKQHPQFGGIPVVLMSGVVNKTVADKAVSVQADELIRKPFQPQELIGRVKALLNPKSSTPAPAASDRPSFPNIPGFPASANVPSAANALNSLFAPAPPPPPQTHAPAPPPSASEQRVPESAWPRALAEALPPPPAPTFPPTKASRPSQHNTSTQPQAPAQLRSIPSNDAQKL